MEFYEKAIIIEPLFDCDNEQEKIAEIENLLSATGAILFATITQKIRVISPSTIVGTGKLLEIKNLVIDNKIDFVVFDGELSPSQQNNIADILDCKVISRTTLILDIFAIRAFSPEGKVLVELAQLKYLYPRLSGKGINLSRLGGGIGTRGPGETQLETDRRHIRTRIKYLEKSLQEIEKRRKMQQKRRNGNGVKTVCLVGYTNTGKSTLLNLLANSDVLAKNQLFATLDPTARKAEINGFNIVFIDTVGFVKNLPPALLEAFASTLECAVSADLVLNVCDLTDNWQMQLEITSRMLADLGVSCDVLKVGNKCDLVDNFDFIDKDIIKISAINNVGINNLKQKIVDLLFADVYCGSIEFEYSQNFSIKQIKRLTESCNVDYQDDKVVISYTLSIKNKQNFDDYINSIVK